jgi:hypothetical protein
MNAQLLSVRLRTGSRWVNGSFSANNSFQNGPILDSNPRPVSASLDHFKAWVAAEPQIKLGISRAKAQSMF